MPCCCRSIRSLPLFLYTYPLISEFPSPVRQQNSHHDGAALVDEENLEQGQGRTGKGGDSVVTQEGSLEVTDEVIYIQGVRQLVCQL